MPSTEIVTVSLTPGADIGDPNNEASSIVNDCCNILAKVPGVQSLRFGTVIEDASKLQMFVDWDSKQKFDDFMVSEAYPPFLDKFKKIIAGPPSFMHIDFDGDLAGALKAPVTEVATFYFQGGVPEGYTQKVKDFIELCIKETPDQKVYGYATGVTSEEVEKDGVKGTGGVLVLGWESVEQHMEFRKTEVFQNNAGSMRQGAQGIEVHHTALFDFVAS